MNVAGTPTSANRNKRNASAELPSVKRRTTARNRQRDAGTSRHDPSRTRPSTRDGRVRLLQTREQEHAIARE
jgi:hypothetical protein